MSDPDSFSALQGYMKSVLMCWLHFYINGLTRERVITPLPKHTSCGQLMEVSHLQVLYQTLQGSVCFYVLGAGGCA